MVNGLNTNLDVRRHLELFDPYTFNMPVNIIGAGATGSWLALCLAKLGITQIQVWDNDEIEEHNVPNQAYEIEQVGLRKVDALQMNLEISTKYKPVVHFETFVNQRIGGIVFLMVDSMKARKEIWENSLKMKPNVKLLIEPRMGLNEGRIYVVEPTDLLHIKRYEECWYSDEEAETSACGASQSVITTAMGVASMCARQLIHYANRTEMDNEILIDFMYNQIYPTKW